MKNATAAAAEKTGRSSSRRTLDRLRAFCRSSLSAHQIIGEQIRVIAGVLNTNSVPAFYVLENRDVPQSEFQVWRGTETMTDEIRAALSSNFWPGPPQTPSPQDLLSGQRTERFVAVTLWGSHTPAMPWESLWRERNVRHGLYGTFFSRKGRIGIMLASRGNDEVAFDDSHVNFVQDCAPYLEAALDQPIPASDQGFSPAESVQIRFGADGRIAAMSFGGPEILRDLAGGGPRAATLGRQMVEQANQAQIGATQLDSEARTELTLAGSVDERAFRSSMFDLSLRPIQDPDRRGVNLLLQDNGYGRFQLRISTMIGLNGEMERLGTLTRFVPPLLLRLRGALAVQASGREIQLLCALGSDATMKTAAKELNIAVSTARTLSERLAARVSANGMVQAADRLMEIGRSAEW